MGQHKWTELDNYAVYLAYKKNLSDKSIEKLANYLNIPVSSVLLKMENIKYLESKGKEGLSHYDKMIESIYYKNKLKELEKTINELEK